MKKIFFFLIPFVFLPGCAHGDDSENDIVNEVYVSKHVSKIVSPVHPEASPARKLAVRTFPESEIIIDKQTIKKQPRQRTAPVMLEITRAPLSDVDAVSLDSPPVHHGIYIPVSPGVQVPVSHPAPVVIKRHHGIHIPGE